MTPTGENYIYIYIYIWTKSNQNDTVKDDLIQKCCWVGSGFETLAM